MERLSAVWGNPTGGWWEETRRGSKEEGVGDAEGGGESKQSLVNFPEGRPRAWLGRGPGDGQSKSAFQPIKRQAAYHLQSTGCAGGTGGRWGRGGEEEMRVSFFWGGALSEGVYRGTLTFIPVPFFFFFRRLECV